jgi:hypothetical protein
MVQEKIAMKLSVQEAFLKKQLDDIIHGDVYVPESLLYQQYQGAEEYNKKQFIPLHFKSSVISIVKNKLNLTSDNEFKVILPALDAWINEEMENTNTLLDPQKVAEDFLRENDYSDEYGSPPSSSEYEYVAPSSAQVSSASSAQVSSASSAPVSYSSAALGPSSSDSSFSDSSPSPAPTYTRAFTRTAAASTTTPSKSPSKFRIQPRNLNTLYDS